MNFKLLPISLLVALAFPAYAADSSKIELDDIEVTSNRNNGIQPKLRDEVVTTESVTAEDIRKKNASTLNEAIDDQPGVDVQVECSICNVRNVVLNNLPGRFTTIMIDGVPIFSSVSGAYGLDMIGINGIERIDVARGAATSLYSPEALSGSVNIVSKRPTKDESILQFQAGNFGYKRGDAFIARPFDGGAFTASVNANYHDSEDGNGNDVSEYTGYDRKMFGLGIFLDDVANFKVRGRLDVVKEERGGGALGDSYGAIERDMSGNPFDWSKGKGGSSDSRGWIRPDGDFAQATADGQNPILLPNGQVLIPYDGGEGGFSEIIYTDRQQAVMTAERNFSQDTKLKLAFGIANHRQDSFYEGDYYKAKQIQHFTAASIEQVIGQGIYTVGLNYRYEDLESKSVAGGVAIDGLDNYTYRVPALFLQAYHTFMDDSLETNLSLRHDDHNVFGGITTPRFNMALHHTAEASSRFAIGRGFRAPTSFYEQDHGILATTRIERDIDDAELSDNVSYAFEYAADRFAFVASANYNKIKNFALLDSGATDPATGDPITLFTQADSDVKVKGIDATLTYKVTSKLDVTVGAEKFHYDFEPGILTFARPEERFYLRADYDGGNWDVSARANWTGPMDLARFYDYDNNQRYNLDGTPKKDKSPSYWVVDVNGRYQVNDKVAILAGISNLFDFQQADKEDFLFVDSSGEVDVTHFWGPNRGRAGYVGVRLDL